VHETFLRRAIDLASENARTGRGGPFGAVIVRDGAIVAAQGNQVTSSCDPTAHAEICAIREASRKLGVFSLQGCVLYSSCEPCPMCLAAVYWARLDGLYFAATREDAAAAGFDDARVYSQIALPPEQRSLRAQQLLSGEGRAPFEVWRAAAHRIAY
jgi:guanine deaminase